MAIPLPAWKGPDTSRFPSSLVPTPNDGQWRLAERVFFTQELKGPYAIASLYGTQFKRGTVWTLVGLLGYFWVEECTVTPEKGNIGLVRITFAWMGSVPPPEWGITPFEINPSIFRHPFYSSLDAEKLEQVFQAFQATNQQGLAALKAAMAANGTTYNTLQNNLLTKLISGNETWYLVGIKYTWSQYYTTWTGSTIHGGYREVPRYSINGAGPGSIYLPLDQAHGGNWDYLREADELVWSNGLYKCTRTWLGAPYGMFDTDLYGTTPL